MLKTNLIYASPPRYITMRKGKLGTICTQKHLKRELFEFRDDGLVKSRIHHVLDFMFLVLGWRYYMF